VLAHFYPNAKVASDPSDGLEQAVQSTPSNGLMVVAGTLSLVAAIRRLINS
jgi:hypothetical protein